jgi:inositol phosphorylceramide mannosyltransferase catalytic subunit
MAQLDFDDFDKYLLEQQGRIIHQIWFGTIPNKKEAKKAYNKLKLYRDSWMIKNPTWFRVEWNKAMCAQFVKSFYPEHTEMFNKYNYEIQRCDAIRYLILHRYGGWYADMDYYCNRPLDEAMNEYKNDIYFVQSPNGIAGQDDDHISNSLMYSVQGHSYWKQVMLELEKNQRVPYYYGKHVGVMFSTGPGILNRIYSKYKYRYKVKSLPWKLFHPYGIKDEKLSLMANKEIFAIHVGKGSWEDKDSKFLLCWVREWKIVLFIVCMFVIPLFMYLFCRKIFST